jgi:siroheme synthase (precorrin-2 oxidase/ferrochelatase)
VRAIRELHQELLGALLRQRIETLLEPELGEDLERRGVHRISAKIPQKVLVLFEHRHAHASAREQQPEHHASWTAAHDATLRADSVFSGRRVRHGFIPFAGARGVRA